MADPSTDDRPNVVLFMVDQLSARWVEAPALEAIPTPNLDRLRSGGVRFSNAYASNPLCTPARATIATGLTSSQHGVIQNGYALDPDVTTFMEVLQDAGWRTGLSGKFHVRPHYDDLRPDYEQYGFDETHVTEDPRGGEWLDWVRTGHPEYEEAALATVWPSSLPGFESYGPDGENLRERIESIREDFDWGTDAHPENEAWAYTLPFPEEISQTNWITRHGLEFVRDAAGEGPFFAQISYVQPHAPFCPPADYMEEVDVDAIPEPAAPEWVDDPNCPTYFEELPEWTARAETPDDWRRQRQYYFADLVHLDRQLGRVLDALEETGELEETYVIFLSDHGETLLDHGFTGKGSYHYDACIRVPLTIAGPGLEEGVVREAFVQLEDIFPTILDLTDTSAPEPEVGPYMDEAEVPEPTAGRSLVPLCRGENPDDWREAAYVESYSTIESSSTASWARTLRTPRFRYTWYPGEGGEQLFAIGDDPAEQENLAGDPAYEDERRRLKDQLFERVVLQEYPHPPRDRVAYGTH